MPDPAITAALDDLFGKTAPAPGTPADMPMGPAPAPKDAALTAALDDVFKDPKTPGPGPVEVREEQKITENVANAPPDLGAGDDDWRRIMNSPWSSTPQTIDEITNYYKSKGVLAADFKWSDYAHKVITEDANRMAIGWLGSQNLLDVDGPGVDRARDQVRRATVAFSLTSQLPMFGQERTRLSGTVLRRLIQSKRDQISSEFKGANMAPTPDGEQQLMDLTSMLNLPDAKLDDIAKKMRYLTYPETLNTVDATFADRMDAEKGPIPFLSGFVGSTRATRGQEKARFEGVGKFGGFTAGTIAAPLFKDGTDKWVEKLYHVFGSSAAEIFTQEYNTRQAEYLINKSGLNSRGEAGYTTDGNNWVSMVNPGALAVLADAKAKKAQEGVQFTGIGEVQPSDFSKTGLVHYAGNLDKRGPAFNKIKALNAAAMEVTAHPEYTKTLLQIANERGPEAARQAVADLTRFSVVRMGNDLAQRIQTPPEELQAPTPYQESRITGLEKAGLLAGEAMPLPFTVPVAAATAVERAVSDNPLSKWLADKTSGLLFGDTLQGTSRNPLDLYRVLKDQIVSGRNLWDVFTGKAYYDELEKTSAFKNLTPDERRSILASRGSLKALYYEKAHRAEEGAQEDMNRLNAYGHGKGDFLPALGSLLRLTGKTGWDMLAEPALSVVDNPEEVVGLYAGAKVMGKATNLVSDVTFSPLRKGLAVLQLDRSLREIAHLDPTSAETLRAGVKRQIKEDIALGKDVDTRLIRASAIADTVSRDVQRTGIIEEEHRGPFTSAMRKAYPLYKEKLPGLLGRVMNDPNLTRSVTGALENLWGALRQSTPPSINPRLVLAMDRGRPGTAANTIADVLQAGPSSQAFNSNFEEFVAEHNRLPTPKEMEVLMPQPFLDLFALMRAGEKVNWKDPKVIRTLQGLGIKPVWEGEAIRGAVERADATIASIQHQALVSAASHFRWGATRGRALTLADGALAIAQKEIDHVNTGRRLFEGAVEDATGVRLSEVNPADLGWGPEARPILDAWAAFNERLTGLERERTRLADHRTRVAEHRFHEEFRHPTATELPELWSRLDEGTLDLLMQQNPGLFPPGWREALWQWRKSGDKTPLIKKIDEAMYATEASFEDAMKTAEKAMSDPLNFDAKFRKLREEVKYAEQELKDYQRAPTNEADPEGMPYQEALKRAREAHRARSKELREGATPDVAAQSMLRATKLRELHKRLADERAYNLDNTYERAPRPDFFDRVRLRLSHPGLGAFAEERAHLQEIKDGLAGAGLTDFARNNPFFLKGLPDYMRVEVVYRMIRSMYAKAAAAMARGEEYLHLVNRLREPERLVLNRAMNDEIAPTELVDAMRSNPELAKAVLLNENIDPATYGEAFRTETLDKLWWQDKEGWKDLHDLMAATGKYEPRFTRFLRRGGYERQLYEAQEAPGLVANAKARQAISSTMAGGQQMGDVNFGMDNSEFMLRRDPYKWRLRIEEPERIIDEKFSSMRDAVRWLRDKYGPRAVRKMGRKFTGDGQLQGRTLYGDRFTLSRPLGEEFLRINLPIEKGKFTAENRAKALRQAYSDVTQSLLLDALNMGGGYVLTGAELDSIAAKSGETDMRARFQKLPDDPQTFGNLAGKYLDRRILAEMNRSASTFKAMENALERLRLAFQHQGDVPTELAARTTGALGKWLFDGPTQVARNSLIFQSIRTWVANKLFNPILSDHLIGGPRYWSAEGAPAHAWATKTLGAAIEAGRQLKKGRDYSEWTKGKEVFTRDPVFEAARERNIITGFYETGSRDTHAAELRMIGMERSVAELETLRADRQKLLQELEAGDKQGSATRVRKHIIALEQMIADKEEAVWKKRLKALTELWLPGWSRGAMGTPRGGLGNILRSRYNMVDEHFKLTKFKQLVDQGYNYDEAAHIIKMYAQNYAEVPYWLKGMPTALRSMIISFPYEFGRIMKNAMVYRPERFLGVMSVVPILNLMQMSRAGISWDRMDEMLRSRGYTNSVDKALNTLGRIWVTDPETGDIADEINLTSFLDVNGFFTGRGVLRQATDMWFPRAQRSLASSMALMPIEVGSNFILNHPVYSGVSYALAARNPATGRPLISMDAKGTEKIWEGLKLLSATFLPPTAPLGRDMMAVYDSLDQPINPKTGQPERLASPVGNIAKAFLAIGVKGKTEQAVAAALGIGPPRTPKNLVNDRSILASIIYDVSSFENGGPPASLAEKGPQVAARHLARYIADTTFSPEDRERANAELAKVLTEPKELTLEGQKVDLGTTEREAWLKKNAMTTESLEALFDRLGPDAQAVILARADRAGISDQYIRALTQTMTIGKSATVTPPNDPEQLARAIKVLEWHRKVDPSANPRIADLIQSLKGYEAWAKARRAIEVQMYPVKKQLEDALEGALQRKMPQ